MKKSVKGAKCLPQERANENTTPTANAYLIFRFSTNNASIAKKKTTIPI